LSEQSTPVVIIGAGPAGIACSLQLRRSGLNPLLLERDRPGGLLNQANQVENYPGFPHGIAGTSLVGLLRRHLRQAGIRVHRESVQRVALRQNHFFVITSRRTIRCRVLVIASGTAPKTLSEAIVAPTVRNRILYEPCRLLRMRGKIIAVIGAGDAAFDYALGLVSRHHVIILNRRERPGCLAVLLDRVRREKKIRHLTRFRIRAIGPGFPGVIVSASDGRSVRADYVVAALGRVPSLDFLTPALRARVQSLCARRRLWLIGDVRNGRFRQAGISIGDGIRCAMWIASRRERTMR